MARYYGTLAGSRGPTSRLGCRQHGLQVTAQSYQGDIVVEFHACDTDVRTTVPGKRKGRDKTVIETEETDMVTIRARAHGGYLGSVCLYHGPVRDLVSEEGVDGLLRRMALKHLEKEHGQ